MQRYIECVDPEQEAKHLAAQVMMILKRDSVRVSPGQWNLVEKYMDTICINLRMVKQFPVSDYVRS